MSKFGTLDKMCLGGAILGFVLVFVSAVADRLGLDLTPGVGLLQISGILIGLTLMTAAGYLFIRQRQPQHPLPLMADVGYRMGLSGLLACYVTGMADMLGVGTHQGVRFERPFFGPLQWIGFSIGLLIILIGLILFWVGGRRPTFLEDSPEL